jgi:hypothetical protein
VVTRMRDFPPGAWDIGFEGMQWYGELAHLPKNSTFKRIATLSSAMDKEIKRMMTTIQYEEEIEDEEEVIVVKNEKVRSQREVGTRTEVEMVANDPKVRFPSI